MGSNASESAKQSPTTGTLNRHTHSPTPPQLIRSFSSALTGIAVVRVRAGTPRVVERAGVVVEELDGTVKITALHRDPATIVIPTGTHLAEAVVAVAAG